MSWENDLGEITALKAHRLQVTHQRLAIFLALQSSKHASAEEIHQKVKMRFPMISLGTVYKNLEKFYEVGLVQKVKLTDVARYETKTDSHHHLFCLKCETIHDIPGPIGEKLSLPEGHGFEILGHEITVKGYCPRCNRK